MGHRIHGFHKSLISYTSRITHFKDPPLPGSVMLRWQLPLLLWWICNLQENKSWWEYRDYHKTWSTRSNPPETYTAAVSTGALYSVGLDTGQGGNDSRLGDISSVDSCVLQYLKLTLKQCCFEKQRNVGVLSTVFSKDGSINAVFVDENKLDFKTCNYNVCISAKITK